MGRPVMLDQGFAGLVLQLFEGGGRDAANGRHIGLGLQQTGAFAQHLEGNLSHGLIRSL